jgi:uncharacterized RDD family membrane protein YckC
MKYSLHPQTGRVVFVVCSEELDEVTMECPRCKRSVDAKSHRCTWCGINVLPGQHLLEESGVVVRMPGKSAGSESGSGERTRLASLGDRFVAMVLDSAVVLTACAMVDAWAFMKWGIVSGSELRLTAASVLAGGSLSLVIAFCYVWLLEASFGSTLGKAVVGIGVVNSSERSSLAASAIRNLLRVVDGIGFYLLGGLIATCSKFRRRIGDICADTYIVEGNLSELTRSLAVLAWVALLSAGIWALPHICARPKPDRAPRHFGRVLLALGHAERSVYLRVPNHGVDLSLVSGAASENARNGSDQLKASEMDKAESLRTLP